MSPTRKRTDKKMVGRRAQVRSVKKRKLTVFESDEEENREDEFDEDFFYGCDFEEETGGLDSDWLPLLSNEELEEIKVPSVEKWRDVSGSVGCQFTMNSVSKSLAAFAFRSGTDNVSTAISTLHRRHHWEGISLVPAEHERYKDDEFGLIGDAIKRVAGLDDELEGERLVIQYYLENEVRILNLFIVV